MGADSDGAGAAAGRSGSLAGTRVLEVGQAIAGPLCTRLLADAGAQVIKIEPPAGDLFRKLPVTYAADKSTAFAQLNWGKRSVALDLGQDAGREALRRLASEVDVIVANVSAAALARAGLAPDAVVAFNPRVVYCPLSIFPAADRYAAIRGYGMLAEARLGLQSILGTEGRPVFSPLPLCDIIGGISAFGAVCAALVERAATGRGRLIEFSIANALNFAMGGTLAKASVPSAERGADNNPPTGFLRAADGGHVAYAAFVDHDWAKLAQAVGGEALDQELKTLVGRRSRVARVYALLQDWAGRHPDAAALESALHGIGIPAAEVSSLEDYAAELNAGQGGPSVGIAAGELGLTRLAASDLGLGVPPPDEAAVPDIGQHTWEVLAEIGRYSASGLLELQRLGAAAGPKLATAPGTAAGRHAPQLQ